jgi:hypothetical protein
MKRWLWLILLFVLGILIGVGIKYYYILTATGLRETSQTISIAENPIQETGLPESEIIFAERNEEPTTQAVLNFARVKRFYAAQVEYGGQTHEGYLLDLEVALPDYQGPLTVPLVGSINRLMPGSETVETIEVSALRLEPGALVHLSFLYVPADTKASQLEVEQSCERWNFTPCLEYLAQGFGQQLLDDFENEFITRLNAGETTIDPTRMPVVFIAGEIQ